MGTLKKFDNNSAQLIADIGNGIHAKAVVLVDTDGNAVSGGGGGSGSDRELVVTTYLVKTAFTGASVGDTVTATQVIDVTSTPTTVSTIWRNQTTAADLAGAPSAANLTLVASDALTDAQLRASAVSVAGAATDAYGTGTRQHVTATMTRQAVGSASARVALPTLGASREIYVMANTRCFFVTGDSTVTAAAGAAHPLAQDERFYIRVPAGHTHIAYIRDTADGFINVCAVA